MAFASAIVGETVFGNKRVKWGTYTNGLGDTGGDVNTGLQSCEALVLQPGGSSAIATAPVVDETLPVSGNAVTIVTADNEDGTWLAIGY
jgi:hypothetical protein